MWTQQQATNVLMAIFNNDVATLAPMLADDVDWHTPRSAPPTHQGGRIGRDAVLEMLAGGPNSPYVPGSKQPMVERILITDHIVAACYRMRSQLKSGRAYENQYSLFFRLKDDQIIESWEHVDSVRFYALLGVDPVWLRGIGDVAEIEDRTNAESMLSESSNARRAVDFIRAFHGQGEGASTALTDDVIWHVPASVAETSKVAVTRDEILERGAKGDLSPFAPGTSEPTIEVSTADGDLAAVQLRLKARTRDGRHYNGHYGYFFRFEDACIAEVWEYYDTAVLAGSLDKVPG